MTKYKNSQSYPSLLAEVFERYKGHKNGNINVSDAIMTDGVVEIIAKLFVYWCTIKFIQKYLLKTFHEYSWMKKSIISLVILVLFKSSGVELIFILFLLQYSPIILYIIIVIRTILTLVMIADIANTYQDVFI
jgi:hypothetical protein